MIAHNGFWAYAAVHGSERTKTYVQLRKELSDAVCSELDGKFLCNGGGRPLRKQWLALDVDERKKYIVAHPDERFSLNDTNGIKDERGQYDRKGKISEGESAKAVGSIDSAAHGIKDERSQYDCKRKL